MHLQKGHIKRAYEQAKIVTSYIETGEYNLYTIQNTKTTTTSKRLLYEAKMLTRVVIGRIKMVLRTSGFQTLKTQALSMTTIFVRTVP